MSFFNFRNKNKENEITATKSGEIKIDDKDEKVEVIKRPRICCFDLSKQTINRLKESRANIFVGSLGSKINIPNTQPNQGHQILYVNDFPPNLHEFDVVIVDLQHFDTIDWKKSDHTQKKITGKSANFFVSPYPETLFDPRPFTSFMLQEDLDKIKRQFLVIAFSTQDYEVEYETAILTNDNYPYRKEGSFSSNIYSFWHDTPLSQKLSGKEIRVENDTYFTSFLEKYKNDTIYNQTFYHPTNWNNETHTQEKDPNFIPLMTNLHNDIISFAEFRDNGNLFIFPQIEDKANFLLEFLSDIAPSIFPEIFPYSSTFRWKGEKNYWLPNHSELLAKKDEIQDEYERKIHDLNSEIKKNSSDLSFLHDLISETDEKLVESIIQFLKWLGFNDSHSVDETKSSSSIKEEDIQVNLPNGGLLVIECKGIGGTSTDSDCSQISKIKHRRCKERNSFDVYALYIVNHQRFMPPLKRKNPPFSEHQIQDAENDERGLLSTWQLFSLYFDIENEIISKEEARELILDFGLVEFRPKNLKFIDKPTEIFKEGKVCIVDIDNEIVMRKNEEILVEKNDKFSSVKIVEIQENDQEVTEATNGEFGLLLNSKIQKNSKLWKKIKK